MWVAVAFPMALAGLLLFGCGARAGHVSELPDAKPMARAGEIIRNPDATRTFVEPRIVTAGGILRVGSGVPGMCRLFGMDGFLSDYVKWSADVEGVIDVKQDGTLGEETAGRFIESMTCFFGESHRPVLEASGKQPNADGSVTIEDPVLYVGTDRLRVVSGHLGACRLLGYEAAVADSLIWSEGRARGVSLAGDGQIYERGEGTFMISLGCGGRTNAE